MSPEGAAGRGSLVRRMAVLVGILSVLHLLLGAVGAVPSDWTWTAWPLLAVAVATWALDSAGVPWTGNLFAALMGWSALLAPWTIGGVRHPLLFLGLAWILLATFAVAPGWGFLGVFAFLADLVLLQVARAGGWIVDAPPPVQLVALDAAMLAVIVSTIVRSPLRAAHENTDEAYASLAERKALEKMLLRSNSDLEAQVESRRRSLLEARGALKEGVDRISAAYREAIGAMRRDAEELALGADGDDEVDWAIRRLAISCHRMERIHESFLRFCRIGERGPSLQAIPGRSHEALVMDAWTEVRQAHPSRDFTFLLEPLSGIEADPDLLRQVWLNLLSNAAKYTAPRTSAWIRVASSGPWFLVEDNGVGFDPRASRDLFGLFQRLHPASEYPGDGIGLATVRRIVECHGGRIEAESVPGEGAKFRFRLGMPDSPLPDAPSLVAKEGRSG